MMPARTAAWRFPDAYQTAHPETACCTTRPLTAAPSGVRQTLYDNARGDYIFINGSDGQWRTAECLRMMEPRDRYILIAVTPQAVQS